MSEINLKMLPKSLIDFNKENQEVINLHGLNVVVEYLSYLKQNQAIHHYNGSSLEQWFCKSIEEWCKTFGCFLE